MGARPLTAMNLVAWPADLGMAHLAEILRGGAEKVVEAGAELAGGHSIDDKEPKYGLAVTGVARPDEIVYNGGALPGDRLVLTKRLGIGVLASALKKGLITEDDMMPAIEEAAALNAAAAAAMTAVGVHACTDVSGFGLAGHLSEMLDASDAAAAVRPGRGAAARRRPRAHRAGRLRRRPAQQPRLPAAAAASAPGRRSSRTARGSTRPFIARYRAGPARARAVRPADVRRPAHGRRAEKHGAAAGRARARGAVRLDDRRSVVAGRAGAIALEG